MKQTEFIDTQEGVAKLVDWISCQDTWLGDFQPALYIDAEGERLGRNGTLSLLSVLVYPDEFNARPNIIDIHTLGSLAFSTVGTRGKSLKDILESPKIIKVFFDVRNDSDALHAHYGIKLQGIRDVQLIENARRQTTSSRRFVSGLARCIEDALYGHEKSQWRLCKEKGEKLWNPNKGGTYSAFNVRPLPGDLVEYCVGDIRHLPALYKKYRCGTDRWGKLIAEESQSRVSISQTPGYSPQGTVRALSPWSAEQNRTLDSWSEVNPPNDYFGDFVDDDLDIPSSRYDDDWGYDYNDYEDWTRADWQGPPS